MSGKCEKITDRIRRLLALANSTDPNEAALAAAKARALMDEHQIKEFDLESTEFISIIFPQKGLPACDLANGLAELNDCQSFIRTVRYRGAKLVGLRGYKADVKLAEQLFNKIWWLMEGHMNGEFITGRSPRHQFRAGYTGAVSDRLRAAAATRREQQYSSGTALVLMKEVAITDHFGELGKGKTRYDTAPKNMAELKAFARGSAIGAKVHLGQTLNDMEAAA